MSYNHTPKWTKSITIPGIEEIKCPVCGNQEPNEEILEVIQTHGYYKPRHIPPAIIGTCANIECPMCDEPYEIKLSVVVSVEQVS